MPIITLTKGYTAVVDQEDFDLARQHVWHVLMCPTTNYAMNRRLGALHRFIMRPPTGLEVSHIDGNGLNCCRYNMENTTHSNNIRTTIKPRGAVPFIGVSIVQRRGRKGYRACIRMPDGTHPSLGYYDTAEEAARAYDLAVLRAYGPHHARNFPNEKP